MFSEADCSTPTLGFQDGLVLLLYLLTENIGMDVFDHWKKRVPSKCKHLDKSHSFQWHFPFCYEKHFNQQFKEDFCSLFFLFKSCTFPLLFERLIFSLLNFTLSVCYGNSREEKWNESGLYYILPTLLLSFSLIFQGKRQGLIKKLRGN